MVTAYLYTIAHSSDPLRIYVGKTIAPRERLAQHRRAARWKGAPLYVWWRSLPSDPHLVVIEERPFSEKGEAEAWAYAREVELIAEVRAAGLKTLNANDGGRGARSPSQETRAKMREAALARSPEVRARIAAATRTAHLGKYPSSETRERMSAAKAGRKRAGHRGAWLARKDQ